jgi:hypothetical protein
VRKVRERPPEDAHREEYAGVVKALAAVRAYRSAEVPPRRPRARPAADHAIKSDECQNRSRVTRVHASRHAAVAHGGASPRSGASPGGRAAARGERRASGVLDGVPLHSARRGARRPPRPLGLRPGRRLRLSLRLLRPLLGLRLLRPLLGLRLLRPLLGLRLLRPLLGLRLARLPRGPRRLTGWRGVQVSDRVELGPECLVLEHVEHGQLLHAVALGKTGAGRDRARVWCATALSPFVAPRRLRAVLRPHAPGPNQARGGLPRLDQPEECAGQGALPAGATTRAARRPRRAPRSERAAERAAERRAAARLRSPSSRTRPPRRCAPHRGRGHSRPFNKLFRAFALRRAGLVSESNNKLQYT